MKDFEDKVIVITGAGAGIGRALAENLSRLGARLALSDIHAEGAEQVAVRCQELGADARSYALDVSDRHAFISHAAQVAADFGGANVVINNAGVSLVGELTECTWEQLDWINSINVNGVLNGSKAFLPLLIASGDGHLVNISSLWGLVGGALESHYCAAKFYVRGLTESLRLEMRRAGHPVGVTVVHPGFIKTDLLRSGQVAGKHDVAKIADFVDRWVPTSPDKVARKIIRGIHRDKARVLVGPDAVAFDALTRLTGAGYQRALSALPNRLLP